MARKLKVFSAQMGFVRAVVAAPSRKAALEAWGVRDDLFARDAAKAETAKAPGRKIVAKAKPPPSREALDKAEAQLKAAQAARRTELAEIEAEQAALDAKRDALQDRLRRSVDARQKTLDREKAAYDEAFKAWSG